MKGTISVANSGSIQSRLSAAKSQSRLRTPSHVENAQYPMEKLVHDSDVMVEPASWNSRLGRWIFWCLPADSQSLRHRLFNSLWGWIFLAYCAVCLLFFSINIFSGWKVRHDAAELSNLPGTCSERSPLSSHLVFIPMLSSRFVSSRVYPLRTPLVQNHNAVSPTHRTRYICPQGTHRPYRCDCLLVGRR